MALIEKRASWQILRDSVFALIMRELRSRYGDGRLSYFWALAVPAGQTGLMVLVFSSVGRQSLTGVSVALFMLIGLLPFKMFTKTFTQISKAIDANSALLSYRQVEPIDPVLARLILELFHFLLVSVVLLAGLAWLGMEVLPERFLEVLAALVLLALLAAGMGLVMCSVDLYWESGDKFFSVLMTPLMFISGVFFTVTMVPEQYWHLITWNPVLHALELIRSGWFRGYSSPVADWSYLVKSVVFIVTVGLILYWHNRPRFVSS